MAAERMLYNALEPMNHREIEYTAAKLSGCDIPDAFSCAALLQWLEETGQRVFDEALVMDYGTDCLRLYLMFERTPRPQDAPYYESWQEGALEGLYKFLSRYRRMILAADAWNRSGGYSDAMSAQDIERMRGALADARRRIERSIARGNTLSDRHSITAALMSLQKLLQKELRINEIVSGVRTVADGGSKALAVDARIAEICKAFICMMAPFAPNLSKVLWKALNDGEKENR
ncbi:MAG: hypothetical protein NC337_10180 [Roseburia sp.]|nr:hypothetical protein [Roseburia sp.]